MTAQHHEHCSERELAHENHGKFDDGSWEDCTWCATIMFLNDLGYNVPVTHTEAEALRHDAGVKPTGASAAWQNILGIKRRYPDFTNRIRVLDNRHFNLLWDALKPGAVAVVQGSMGAFGRGHYLRRWDPNFAGTHAMEIERRDAELRVWLDDPLAPPGPYKGQWMSKEDLRLFVQGYAAGVSFYAYPELPPIAGGPSQGVDDMVGFTLQPGLGRGSVKIKPVAGHPNAHSILDLTTGATVRIDDNVERQSYGKGALDHGITPGGGDGSDRRNGYLITVPGTLPGRPAWVLATDATFTPPAAPAQIDCKPLVDEAHAKGYADGIDASAAAVIKLKGS